MKRRRTLANKSASTGISIKEVTESKDGYEWTTYVVQGWKEAGKWQRKRFKKRKDAEAFAAVKRIALQNAENQLNTVVTSLSVDQVKQAESAITRLGERYTLDQAIGYFMDHFCEPDFQIRWSDAVGQYIDDREHQGGRPNSIKQTASVLGMAQRAFLDPHVHEVTAEDIERFLRGLRGKDGTNRAAPKTWNNYRADLHAFLGWCAEDRRRWIGENPAAKVKRLEVKRRGLPDILTAEETMHIMSLATRWRGGVLAKHYALLFFAGIRPELELARLAKNEGRYIDMKRGVIHIEPEVSKTDQYRQVPIRENLLQWLHAFPGPIIPKNFDRLVKRFRKHCRLTHDVARHTFISHHVSAFKSVGEASLEAGNSEFVVKKHYLNLATATEGEAFWRIIPGPNKRAIIDDQATTPSILKLA
jgi:hypothetical protein